jgi:hypothetical protein
MFQDGAAFHKLAQSKIQWMQYCAQCGVIFEASSQELRERVVAGAPTGQPPSDGDGGGGSLARALPPPPEIKKKSAKPAVQGLMPYFKGLRDNEEYCDLTTGGSRPMIMKFARKGDRPADEAGTKIDLFASSP